MGSEDSDREQLIEPGVNIDSLDELVSLAGSVVAARLWATCRWGEWNVGDFRFVIFSIRPDEETDLFVQFWSEPGEVVSAEVCSGNWNPGAVAYVRKEQRRAIEALGYAQGGRAKNYQKVIAIESPQDAEVVAQEVLSVLFNVFGYRGQWPLEIKRGDGTRAESRLVYESLTPEDFMKIAVGAGYRAGLDGSGPVPAVMLQKSRRRSVASLSEQVPGNRLYAAVTLFAVIEIRRKIDDGRLLKMNAKVPGARLLRGDQDEIVLQQDIHLRGGVTAQWLLNKLAHWHHLRRIVERLLDRPARPRTRTRSNVH